MKPDDQTHTPKISVIIPAYNQARFLDTAVQSVFAQTYQDYEIILVNDGSTDETAAAAAQYGERIHYIYQENRGLAGARNTGIRAARGELVCLLDSDDEWLPGYLEAMAALAEQQPGTAVFTCAARCMDVEGKDLPQVVGCMEVEASKLYWELLRANFIIPSTVTMRRSVALEAGLFDEGLRSLEDWDLWLRLLPEHIIHCGTAELARYRIHGSSLSANVAYMNYSNRIVVEKHFGKDDGAVEHWSAEKRRAYGGMYRYALLMGVQRQNVWEAGALCQALRADPSLAESVSMFYELGLGNQPIGRRVAEAEKVSLRGNAHHLMSILNEVFGPQADPDLLALRKTAYATANQALGLLAYNGESYPEARKYLVRAMRLNPKLCLDGLIAGDFLKSFLKPYLRARRC